MPPIQWLGITRMLNLLKSKKEKKIRRGGAGGGAGGRCSFVMTWVSKRPRETRKTNTYGGAFVCIVRLNQERNPVAFVITTASTGGVRRHNRREDVIAEGARKNQTPGYSTERWQLHASAATRTRQDRQTLSFGTTRRLNCPRIRYSEHRRGGGCQCAYWSHPTVG